MLPIFAVAVIGLLILWFIDPFVEEQAHRAIAEQEPGDVTQLARAGWRYALVSAILLVIALALGAIGLATTY